MSVAYEMWVEREYARLDLAITLERRNDSPYAEHYLAHLQNHFDNLTKQQKELRKLFAKGRKEGRRR